MLTEAKKIVKEEQEEARRGELIAEILMIKRVPHSDRYNTAWGTKTALGLYRVMKRLVEEGR